MEETNATETKFCQKCGKQIRIDAEFCPYCGAQQQVSRSVAPEPAAATQNQAQTRSDPDAGYSQTNLAFHGLGLAASHPRPIYSPDGDCQFCVRHPNHSKKTEWRGRNAIGLCLYRLLSWDDGIQ
ncbi:zinc-ribbon domain-containing protein [Levilactobacillus suantsaii]|uniref:Zinc ribbon domain-containing protein n=1 Tax=Levilactobacillus suantsaii TaxID=2292255 RepID=A0A4Q0VFQ5_9LACO|nr:zinc-ribbon domain-containing protein [Levilactobacillus suantsaii]RXI76808.1 zinc ribbon domain-containing protein [Levilactobacillus suantsaii]